jgi:hypothetical protein
LPLLDYEVDKSEPFVDAELLYRRVSPEEVLLNGELDASRFKIKQYSKDAGGSPSVIRSKFAPPEDVLHPDCAGGKTYHGYFIFRIPVSALPQDITAEDGKLFSAYPAHLPEPKCGAHSVIATCVAGDAERKYAKPSRTAINDLRVKLARDFQRQPDHVTIAELAYEMWEAGDRPDHGEDERWLAAEQRLLQMTASRVPHP